MCGRITLTTAPEIVAEVFGLSTVPFLSPRYNIAPSQLIPIVRLRGDPPRPELEAVRWGLVPTWAKDASIGHRMINARAETLAEKPAFRAAFRSRRCLVVADGFYEWRQGPQRKQPSLIRRRDQRPFAIAGLWESWLDADRAPLLTCTIVTTEANPLMAPIHERMPALIDVAAYRTWMDPFARPGDLVSLLSPCADGTLEAFAVSARVNNPKYDDAECLEPLAPTDA